MRELFAAMSYRNRRAQNYFCNTFGRNGIVFLQSWPFVSTPPVLTRALPPFHESTFFLALSCKTPWGSLYTTSCFLASAQKSGSSHPPLWCRPTDALATECEHPFMVLSKVRELHPPLHTVSHVVYVFLKNFTTKATWPCLSGKQNQSGSVSQVTSSGRSEQLKLLLC